jgi:PmbA protein
MTDYLELAKSVVARAATSGVEAEAYIQASKETEIVVDGGQVEQLMQSGAKGIGIRIIDGGRTGYVYTSDFSEASLDRAIQTARELAEVATADGNRGLPEPQEYRHEDLEIYDPALEAVSTEDKIALALKSEAVALETDSRMFQARSHYGDAIVHVHLANSKGFAGSYYRTIAYNYIIAVARDEASGDMAQSFGFGFSNFYNEVDPVAVGREAAYKTTMTLGAGSLPTQKMTVIFDGFVMSELLAYLSMALNAEAMQRGRSFLIGKMGQTVGSDKVTLLDNGRMPRGMSSAPFDGEGVPTSATRLIDEGVLQAVIYDTYNAREAGVMSTGNAQRGSYRTMPQLGMSNFYIQPGHKSHEEIIGEVENGLYVTRIMQTGGINPVSGDCSMAASGQLIENGQLTQPVNGVTVATTLPDLLMSISEVGSNLRAFPIMGSISAPTVRVDNMTIGGTG